MTNSPDKHDPLTVEEFVRVARALYGPDADELITSYEDGWLSYMAGDPLSLGLSSISQTIADRVIATRPDLREKIEHMQRDPEAALAELARQIREDLGAS